MSQKPTKTNFMLVWCLGRETTPYKAAEKYYTTYDPNVKFNPKDTSIIGPFYTAKRELLNQKLLIEMPREKGRDKPIKTNMEVYLADFQSVKPLLSEFEKYAKRIVDLIVDRKLEITNGYEPLFYFWIAKLLLWTEKQANERWVTKLFTSILNVKSGPLKCVVDFKQSLTKNEVKELTATPSDMQTFMELFQLVIEKAPQELLREMMLFTLANPKLQNLRVLPNN